VLRVLLSLTKGANKFAIDPQESIMDFYWHYSSKELIDPAGKANFFKAIGVASQVFNTLTEVIQGPCTQNQQALAHSRY
jgi:ryanodine receptor 2